MIILFWSALRSLFEMPPFPKLEYGSMLYFITKADTNVNNINETITPDIIAIVFFILTSPTSTSRATLCSKSAFSTIFKLFLTCGNVFITFVKKFTACRW